MMLSAGFNARATTRVGATRAFGGCATSFSRFTYFEK
jgi:hypothetical protein